MPSHRSAHRSRQSRRLSNRPPRDTDFEEIDDCDLSLVDTIDAGAEDVVSAPSPQVLPEAQTSDNQGPSSESSNNDAAAEHGTGSHGRKKILDHIPRPPNAFLFYRSYFWAQEKEKTTAEKDHRNISRMAASVWKTLLKEERTPFQRLATQAKHLHAQVFPGYKYAPASKKKQSVKKATKPLDHEAIGRWMDLSQAMLQNVQDLLERGLGIDEEVGQRATIVDRLTPAVSSSTRSRPTATTANKDRKPQAPVIDDDDSASDTPLSDAALSAPATPDHLSSPAALSIGTPEDASIAELSAALMAQLPLHAPGGENSPGPVPYQIAPGHGIIPPFYGMRHSLWAAGEAEANETNLARLNSSFSFASIAAENMLYSMSDRQEMDPLAWSSIVEDVTVDFEHLSVDLFGKERETYPPSMAVDLQMEDFFSQYLNL